jgi:hypothetical protein
VASDLTGDEAGVHTPVAPPAPLQSEARSPRTPHRNRFVFVYAVLGAALVAAIAGVVVYAGRSISPAPVWSSWHPSGGGIGAAKQIGQRVGAQYRLPDGSQLADVITNEPAVSGPTGAQVPIHFVAVQASGGDQVYPASSSGTVMYTLCGAGPGCAIATGKPSVARGTLVRREILELALYTFKYVGGVKSIVAFIPPANGKHFVVFLQKSDLADQLKTPLAKTLNAKTPLPAGMAAREVHVVDATTEARVYTYGVTQAPTGDVVLLLKPVRA